MKHCFCIYRSYGYDPDGYPPRDYFCCWCGTRRQLVPGRVEGHGPVRIEQIDNRDCPARASHEVGDDNR